MALDVRLVITDASPLITLAAASSLDYLLYSGFPVIIPDAVFHEATAAAGKLGAQEIIDWYRANSAAVRIEPTEIFQKEMSLVAARGQRLSRDLGERAALEIVRYTHLLDGKDDRALLLSDDRDVERLVAIDPERIVLLTTWDYLRQLEDARRIQSADAVMSAVKRLGREPSKRGVWDQHDPDVRDAVIAILDQARKQQKAEE